MTPQPTTDRTTRQPRWRTLLPVGLGGLACVACCTIPLWVAGGLTLGASTVALDRCLDTRLPLLILAVVVAGSAVLARWYSRRHRGGQVGAGPDAGCGCPTSEPVESAYPNQPSGARP